MIPAREAPLASRPRICTYHYLIVACVALLSHFSVVFNDFVHDDISLIRSHPRLAEPAFVRDILFRDYGYEFGERQAFGYYRPLFVLTLFLQRQIFGISPIGYRFVSLATLVVSCLVAMGLVWRFSRSALAAFLTGCLYACHPITTESVVFVSTWPDLAMGALLGSALWLGFAGIQTRMTAGFLLRCGFSSLIVLMACLTKEGGFFGAAGIAMGLFAFGRRRFLRRILLGTGWAFAVGAAYAMRGVAGVQGYPLGKTLQQCISSQGAPIEIWAIWHAIGAFLLPGETHYRRYFKYATYQEIVAPWAFGAQIALIAIALVAAILLIWLARRRQPLVAALVGWAIAGSFPLLLAVSVGIPYSERFVSVAPLCMLAGLALKRWIPFLKKFPDVRTNGRILFGSVVTWAVMAMCAGFSLAGGSRAMNPLVFWENIANDQPDLFYAHAEVARIYSQKGNLKAMEEAARRAIELQPNNAISRRLGLHLALGQIVENRPGEALRWYNWTLEILPRERDALQGRAVALCMLRRFDEALKAIDYAGTLFPNDRGIAFMSAKIRVLSPHVTVRDAMKHASEARTLGAPIPDEWLSTGTLEAYRWQGEAVSQP